MIEFYKDVRKDKNIAQFGIGGNGWIARVAMPLSVELWQNTTIKGNVRTAFFGLDFVEKSDTRGIELTLLFLVFIVAWDR